MIDKTKGVPLRVSGGGRAGPYLSVPEQQLSEIRDVLDRASVHYWVDNLAVSISGGPARVVVNFAKGANPDTIQAVLDRA
jgi:hypothetical protein